MYVHRNSQTTTDKSLLDTLINGILQMNLESKYLPYLLTYSWIFCSAQSRRISQYEPLTVLKFRLPFNIINNNHNKRTSEAFEFPRANISMNRKINFKTAQLIS